MGHYKRPIFSYVMHYKTVTMMDDNDYRVLGRFV